MTAPLPADALRLIQEFESCLRRVPGRPGYFQPYLCPARVATIGWGTTVWPNGRKVTMSDEPISQARCDEVFAFDMRKYSAGFDVLNTARLHPLMRGALVSFCYNCGVGAYKRSGLRRAVNAGRFGDVRRELRKWRMGGGRVLRGLERRREAEAALFLKGLAALQRGESEVVSLPPDDAAPINEKTPNAPAAPAARGFWRSLFARWFK